MPSPAGFIRLVVVRSLLLDFLHDSRHAKLTIAPDRLKTTLRSFAGD